MLEFEDKISYTIFGRKALSILSNVRHTHFYKNYIGLLKVSIIYTFSIRSYCAFLPLPMPICSKSEEMFILYTSFSIDYNFLVCA